MKQILTLSVFMVTHLFLKAQTQEDIQQRLTDLNCKVNYEILQITLRLSDELFIQHRDSIALVSYKDAYARLNDYTFGSGCGDQNYYTLVKSNIEYRMLLVENGMDFWGISYNMEPLNPVEHYNRFKALKANFDAGVVELTTLIGQLGNADDKIDEATAGTEMAKTEAKIQDYEKNKHEIRINQHNENIKLIRHNIEVLNDRQKEIEEEAIESSKEIDKLTDGLHDLLISGLGQAIGLPVDPTKIDLKKSVSDNLIKVGANLVNTDPGIQKAIKDISEGMDKLIDVYRAADSTVRELSKLKEDCENIYNTVHKPSFENMMKIGSKIIPQLPADQLQEIRTKFATNQSFSSLLHLSNTIPDLKKLIGSHLVSTAPDLSALENSLRTKPQSFSKWILRGSADALKSSITANEKAIVLKVTLSNFPTEFFNTLPPDAQAEWKKFTGKQSNADVIAWLKSATPEQLKNIEWDNGIATLPNSVAKIRVDETVKKLLTKDLISEATVSADAFRKTIESLGPSAHKLFVGNIPSEWLNDLTQGFFAGMSEAQINTSSAQLHTNINDAVKLDAALSSKVQQEMDALNVGAYFVSNRNNTQPAEMVRQRPAINPHDRMKQSIITGGIQAAVPFVGIAGQFLANLLARGALLRKMEKLFNEQKAISKEKLISYDLLNQMIINERIAMIDKSISEVRQAYALQLFGHHKTRIEKVNRQIPIIRLRIQNQKVLLYYIGEKLREEYAVLNKALLFRHSQNIFEKIISDPNNYRFAIDEDISLFKWLDNSVESSRADIMALKTYWDRIAILIEANCKECDRLYTPFTEALETDPISLKKLFPDEWENFQKAIQDGKMEFDFLLPVLPGKQTFVHDELKKNRVRILDVRMGGVLKGGGFARLINASLFHPGVSYLFDGKQYYKEIFSPQETNGIEPGTYPANNNLLEFPQVFDLNTLRKRWQAQGTLPFQGLEGYGFFSIYRLRMPINDRSKDLADIFLRFGYSYQKNEPSVLADNRKFVIKSSFKKDIELGYDELIALSGNKDWVENIEATFGNNNILLPEEYLKKASIEIEK